MDYDKTKIDEVALALLYLNSFQKGHVIRAWKELDWDVLDRLYEKGYIHDPKNKNVSIVFTDKGFASAEDFFNKHFQRKSPDNT